LHLLEDRRVDNGLMFTLTHLIPVQNFAGVSLPPRLTGIIPRDCDPKRNDTVSALHGD
jgi:hypothetical protein